MRRPIAIYVLLVALGAGAQGMQYATVNCPGCTLSQGTLKLNNLNALSTNIQVATGQTNGAATGTGAALYVNNTKTLSTSGDLLLSVNNNGTNELNLDYAGNGTFAGGVTLAGGDLSFNGGGGNNAIYGAGSTGLTFLIQNNVADGASNIAFTLNNYRAMSTSGALLLSLQNAATQKLGVDYAGNIQAGGTTNPVPVVHSAQTTSPVAMEFGACTLSTGACTVSFATSFSVAPACTCSESGSTVTSGCAVGTPGTGSFTITTLAAASKANWICVGAK